jgi:asparagine N-glycosylation enzyme membrane subunit Stt3
MTYFLSFLLLLVYGAYQLVSYFRKDHEIKRINKLTIALTIISLMVFMYLDFSMINAIIGSVIFMIMIRVAYVIYSDTYE